MTAATVTEAERFLAEVSVLGGLGGEELRELAGACRVARYPRRTAIFHEGDEPTALYGVLSGGVKVYRLLIDGRQRILDVVEPGGVFGLAQALDGRPHPASAMTLPDSEAIVVPRRELLSLLRRKEGAMEAALGALCTEVRALEERIWSELSYRSVAQRVAGLLLRLAGEWGRVGSGGRVILEPPLSRTEMAESLGLPRESVSRALSALIRRGVVSVEGECVIIERPDLLRRRSGRDGPHAPV